LKVLRAAQSVGIALLHVLVGTVGVAVSSAILFYVLKPILSPFISPASLGHDIPLTLPFFPFQSLVGFLSGFLVFVFDGKFGRSREARSAWIIPAGWFLLLFLAWTPHSVLTESRWEHFFWGSLGDSKKEQFVTTLPLLTSIAYALGNYLADKCRLNRDTCLPRTNAAP
jgi:hypothetical protein